MGFPQAFFIQSGIQKSFRAKKHNCYLVTKKSRQVWYPKILWFQSPTLSKADNQDFLQFNSNLLWRTYLCKYLFIRGVVPGGSGGAMTSPDFFRSVTLVLAPPDFQTFLWPCSLQCFRNYSKKIMQGVLRTEYDRAKKCCRSGCNGYYSFLMDAWMLMK